MRRIAYGSETFITTDSVSEELMHRILNLSVREVLELPVLYAEGDVGIVQIVVGPTTMISSTLLFSYLNGLEDSGYIDSVIARIDAIGLVALPLIDSKAL